MRLTDVNSNLAEAVKTIYNQTTSQRLESLIENVNNVDINNPTEINQLFNQIYNADDTPAELAPEDEPMYLTIMNQFKASPSKAFEEYLAVNKIAVKTNLTGYYPVGVKYVNNQEQLLTKDDVQTALSFYLNQFDKEIA